MRVETMTITPEVAAELLDTNYERNRSIRPTWVKTLTNAMLAGEFDSMNGDTIVIGEDDGKLYDGQHRLLAIIKSCTTQTMLVSYVDNGMQAYKTIDAGTPRKTSDFIDAPNKINVAATAKAMYCIEHGVGPLLTTLLMRTDAGITPSRVTVLDFFETNRERVIRTERAAAKMFNGVGCGAISTYAFFLDLIEFCDCDGCLSEFCGAVGDAFCTNKTIVAYKHVLMRKKLSLGNSPLPKSWQLGTTLQAYDAFMSSNGATMLNKGADKLKKYDALLADAREKRGHVVGIGHE